MMTGFSTTTREAVSAIQHGAYGFLMKPFDNIDDLEKLIVEAV
jgi:DNA-binding NtrC family response regulator